MGYIIFVVSNEDRITQRELVRQMCEKLEEANTRAIEDALGRIGEASRAAALSIEELNAALNTVQPEEQPAPQPRKKQRPPRSLGILKQNATRPPARPERHRHQRGRKR